MTRNLTLLILLLTVFSFSSCKKGVSSNELAATVKSMNKSCPQNFEFGSIRSVEYDKDSNEVTFNYRINCRKYGIDFSLLRDNMDQVRDMMIVLGNDGDLKDLFKLMVDSEASLNLVFKDASSPDKFECKLSASDLEKILKSNLSEKEKYNKMLDIQVLIAKSACPVTLDEATKLVDVVRDGNTLRYVNDVDESVIEISGLKDYSSELKESIASQLSSNSASAQLIGAVAALNGDIEYLYKGNKTGDVFTITFSSDELSQMK